MAGPSLRELGEVLCCLGMVLAPKHHPPAGLPGSWACVFSSIPTKALVPSSTTRMAPSAQRDIQCSNLLLNMLIQFQLYPIVCKDCPSIHHPQRCSRPGHRRYLHKNSVIAGQFPVDVILKSIQGLFSELSGSATGELMRPGSAAIWNLGDKWINFALHL